jgi:hypothetical protein
MHDFKIKTSKLRSQDGNVKQLTIRIDLHNMYYDIILFGIYNEHLVLSLEILTLAKCVCLIAKLTMC